MLIIHYSRLYSRVYVVVVDQQAQDPVTLLLNVSLSLYVNFVRHLLVLTLCSFPLTSVAISVLGKSVSPSAYLRTTRMPLMGCLIYREVNSIQRKLRVSIVVLSVLVITIHIPSLILIHHKVLWFPLC